MRIEPAEKTRNITYAIRDVVLAANELKKRGKKVLHLNIGNPNIFDFEPPKHMIDAVYKAMIENKNGYADSHGLEEAREAIVNDIAKKGVKAEIEDVLIGMGVSEIIELCLSALVNPGENFLVPKPGYPLYNAVSWKLHCTPNFYELDEENNWEPNLEDIKNKINEKTKAIIIINPNNPTGSVYSRKTLEGLLEIAEENNLVVFSDEIYDKIILDNDEHISLASLSKEVPVVTMNGLSKNYLAPGWRIGWCIFTGEGISDFKEAVFKLARARLSAPHPFQYAIKPALEGPQDHLKEMNKKLKERRDLTYKRLNEIEGLSLVKPKGAFYAFPKLDYEIENDMKFVLDLLYKKQILVVPGTGFAHHKPDHFRLVFLPQKEVLGEAYNKLEEYILENLQNFK